MRTNSELLERAYAIAEMHFYSDDELEIPWEPYEHFSDEEVKEQVHALAQVILQAMIWSQENEN